MSLQVLVKPEAQVDKTVWLGFHCLDRMAVAWVHHQPASISIIWMLQLSAKNLARRIDVWRIAREIRCNQLRINSVHRVQFRFLLVYLDSTPFASKALWNSMPRHGGTRRSSSPSITIVGVFTWFMCATGDMLYSFEYVWRSGIVPGIKFSIPTSTWPLEHKVNFERYVSSGGGQTGGQERN